MFNLNMHPVWDLLVGLLLLLAGFSLFVVAVAFSTKPKTSKKEKTLYTIISVFLVIVSIWSANNVHQHYRTIAIDRYGLTPQQGARIACHASDPGFPPVAIHRVGPIYFATVDCGGTIIPIDPHVRVQHFHWKTSTFWARCAAHVTLFGTTSDIIGQYSKHPYCVFNTRQSSHQLLRENIDINNALPTPNEIFFHGSWRYVASRYVSGPLPEAP